MIDYRDLLLTYMRMVRDEQGSTLLDSPDLYFNEEEWHALRAMEDEIGKEDEIEL